jgi:cell division septal protein FtsQ
MSVRAPSEKKFRRANVTPGRRTPPGRRRWVNWRVIRMAAAIVLVGYAAVRALELVVSASTLQVRRIAVEGNVRLSAGEVKVLVDGLRGTSILTADLAGYRRKLLESPWVEDVALRRVLPSTIEVFVQERRPVGLCRLGPDLYLVDRHGILIDEFGPQYAEFDLPIIDGLVRSPELGGPVIDVAGVELAARVIDAVSQRRGLAQRLSQIDVSDVRDAVVLLDGDPARLRLGTEQFLERLQTYLDLAPAFRAKYPEIDYVDLRFGELIALRPLGSDRAPRPGGKPAPATRRF